MKVKYKRDWVQYKIDYPYLLPQLKDGVMKTRHLITDVQYLNEAKEWVKMS